MSKGMRALAVAACCAYPALNHAAAVTDDPRWAALGIALVCWALLAGKSGVLLAVPVAAVSFVLALLVAAWMPGALLYAPPVVVNLALCAFFARTLRPGREPLVSRFARVMRGGQLAPDLARYTRNLTAAWAGFFALMAAVSVILAVTGPVAVWSLFSNFLNYVLVALFLVAEYVYRRLRYRHHDHASPRQMISRLLDYKAILR